MDRMPPHDEAAELALIGSLMLAEDHLFVETTAMVDSGDYFSADNQIIHGVLAAMFKAGVKRDSVTLRAELASKKLLEEVGGVGYIAKALEAVPSASHGPHYAEIVQKLSRRRKLISVGHDLVRRAWEPVDVDELAQSTMKAVSGVASSGKAQYHTLPAMVEVAVKTLEGGGTPLIPTGFGALDAIVGGIGLGEVVILAGRPSMGKSTIARQMAYQIAKSGVAVGFISLEESAAKMARNYIAMLAGVENRKIRTGQNLDQQDWTEIDAARGRIKDIPMWITDRARTLPAIRSQMAIWQARHGVQAVFIDYLQRITGAKARDAYERASELSLEVTEAFKALEIAGVVLAQLSRNVASREDKRPVMTDLRDSGCIEQDADGILFIHRDDYYTAATQDGPPPTGIAELIIAKFRDSVRGGSVPLKSNLRYQRFEDVEPEIPRHGL